MMFLLVWLQRWLHRELQAIFLLITHDAGISIIIFSILFLPGVMIHELSHFLSARLLRVKTGKFSIIPKVLPNGKVQLGYVEVATSDIFRDSLIGAAPLIAGLAAVLLIALFIFDLPVLGIGNLAPSGLLPMVHAVLLAQDAWLWIYLLFTISTTMMPSESDRHAWAPLLLVFAGILGLAFLVDGGSWLQNNLGRPALVVSNIGIFLFGLCNFLHILLSIPLFLVRIGISKLTGYQVR